ncbi:MAG: hypothetical protein JWM31_395, partial [Solirubrobacterales bacterium]|nr:hypothetical protein [Solirubrobacterales bacterium]
VRVTVDHQGVHEDFDEALDHAVTAANLLDTIAFLCAKSCQLAAQTGEREEWRDHADYTAFCLSRLAQTRVLAHDFMDAATTIARRRIGTDEELSAEEFVVALTLTAAFSERVLERVPQSVR